MLVYSTKYHINLRWPPLSAHLSVDVNPESPVNRAGAAAAGGGGYPECAPAEGEALSHQVTTAFALARRASYAGCLPNGPVTLPNRSRHGLESAFEAVGNAVVTLPHQLSPQLARQLGS